MQSYYILLDLDSESTMILWNMITIYCWTQQNITVDLYLQIACTNSTSQSHVCEIHSIRLRSHRKWLYRINCMQLWDNSNQIGMVTLTAYMYQFQSQKWMWCVNLCSLITVCCISVYGENLKGLLDSSYLQKQIDGRRVHLKITAHQYWIYRHSITRFIQFLCFLHPKFSA